MPLAFFARRGSFGLCAFFCLFLAIFPARAAWWWPFGNDGIDYAIKINGVDGPTYDWLETLKLTEKNKTNPPKNRTELEQEATSLSERLRKALEARGFYDVILQQQIRGEGKTPVIHYKVETGLRYTIGSIKMDWQGRPLKSIPLSRIETKKGAGVDVGLIQKDAVKMLNDIGKDACLLSLEVVPLLRLQGEGHRADLIFRINHGERANFGPTIIRGTREVADKVVLRSVNWKQGECFRQEKIETTRTSLIQNQLFSSVKITPSLKPDKKGQSPVFIDVKERVPRTITAGASYSTDQGYGVTTGWEHRNYFGGGEKLNADLTLAQQEQALQTSLRLPAFLRNDQVLSLNFGVKHEDRDAYTSNTIETGATVERKLSARINSGLGVAYRISQTDDVLAGKSTYGLLSFPGFLEYNTRDNQLDTRKGIFAHLDVTPYTETFGDGGQFLKTQGTAQTYFSSDTFKLKPTLALKGQLGSITGAKGKDVPSDIRFYAGGGGSVRGYGYQTLSPRLKDEPVGGSSLAVGSAELRLRFTETFGGVAFVDAGNAYGSNVPDFSEPLFYGAGVGIRYYSAIGPLRADIAMPLNGDEIGQTGYAIYVSVGQAF